MKFHFIAFVLAIFALGSCSTPKSSVSAETTDTSDTMIDQNTPITKIPTESFWRLESLKGQDFSSFLKEGNAVGFTMFADNNRISGYAGCNNFFGTYTIEPGNRIRFSEIGSTRMMCPEGEFNESEFLKILGLATGFTLRGNRLELNAGTKEPLAVFTSTAIPLNPIVEKHWKLKTLNGKKVKVEKGQARDIHFTLNAKDMTVSGFAGCNSMSGSYKLNEGNKIFFAQMATTMMACPDMEFNEWGFLKVFELAEHYQIKGKKLELFGNEKEPLAVFESVSME